MKVPWKAENTGYTELKAKVILCENLLGPCNMLGTIEHITLRTGTVSDLSLHTQQQVAWCKQVVDRQEMSVGGMSNLSALSSIISLGSS